MMILKANRQKLNWFHKNNLNVVTINICSKGNVQVFLIVAGICGGVFCGILMREFLSPETIFLNALNLLIMPVVFFSIMNGIIEPGADLGKISLRLTGFSLFLTLAALIISFVVTGILFSGDMPLINTLPVTETTAEGYQFLLIKFIVDLIPADFVSPVLNGKILQIIFISILFGISLNALGNKVALFKELVGNLNDIFNKMMSMVIFFVQPIAFFAMINLALKLNVETVMYFQIAYRTISRGSDAVRLFPDFCLARRKNFL